MYSYFKYGFLFLVNIVHTNNVPYGYSTPSPYGYNYDWPPANRLLWNNGDKTQIYNVDTNEISGNYYQIKEIVKVQIYYESLCPDCIRGSTQLVNTVKKLGSYMDTHVYPYGNAETIVDGRGHVTFKCQHGPEECYGNKLHACAIDHLKNITSAIIFNDCMFKRESNNTAVDECGRLFGVDSAMIKTCAASNKGTQLLKYYGEESKKVGFRFVPYVLINGAEGDEDHLMENVCKAFTYPPPECKGL